MFFFSVEKKNKHFKNKIYILFSNKWHKTKIKYYFLDKILLLCKFIIKKKIDGFRKICVSFKFMKYDINFEKTVQMQGFCFFVSYEKRNII